MVQIEEMSELAQASWKASCASENVWLCNHVRTNYYSLMNQLQVPDVRERQRLTLENLYFDKIHSDPKQLCAEHVSLTRGGNAQFK